MKFNAYFVELKHPEPSLTSNLVIEDETISANFSRVEDDLFIARFQSQVELFFMQEVAFKNKDIRMMVLLPVLSKYNKRKLAKLAEILNHSEERQAYHLLSKLPTIDKFLKIEELLGFFSLPRDDAMAFLVEKELQKELKIISLNHLTTTPYENFEQHLEELDALFTESCTGKNQVQVLKFSEIESKIKVPQTSLFFKYLIRLAAEKFTLMIRKDRVVFKKSALSQHEEESMDEMAEILKKNKLTVFTIENINKLSQLNPKEINDTLWFLVENGEVVQLNEKFFIFTEELNKILNRLKKYKRNQGEMIDIQAFREMTVLSRKYIIPLLEYMDIEGITLRVENQRQILLGA